MLKKQNNSSLIRSKSIIVLGFTGTGKSTLVNYLNDIPLMCMRQKGRWIIAPKYENLTLPNGFQIGHSYHTETLYPAIYSPNDTNFTYIEFSGFQDASFEIELANTYFVAQTMRAVERIKFLLLIKFDDLIDRGQIFIESIKRFSDLIGILNEEKSIKHNIEKSIGIIITRVNNDGETDQEMIEYLKKKMLYIVERSVEHVLTQNEAHVFTNIIMNGQVGIFSNPRKNHVTISQDQSLQIKRIIKNSLEYFNKSDLRMNSDRIDSYYKPSLITYIDKKCFRFLLDLVCESSRIYFTKSISSLKELNEAEEIYRVLSTLLDTHLKFDFSSFLNNSQIFSNTQEIRKELLKRQDVCEFFIELINFDYEYENLQRKNRLFKDFNFFLERTLIDLILKRYEEFLRELSKTLIKNLNRELTKKDEEIIFQNIKNKFKRDSKQLDFDLFVNDLGKEYGFREIFSKIERESFGRVKKAIDFLMQKMELKGYTFY